MGVTSLQAPEATPTATTHAGGFAIDPRSTEAADALDAGDYARVLTLTETPSTAPAGDWLDYDRAMALTALDGPTRRSRSSAAPRYASATPAT